MSLSVKEYLSWVEDILNMEAGHRASLVKKILDDIKEEIGDNFYTMLTSADVEFVGISPSTRYIKTKGSAEDLDAIWVHPFSVPTLLFYHKKTHCLINAGAAIRFNDSILNEIAENRDQISGKGIMG